MNAKRIKRLKEIAEQILKARPLLEAIRSNLVVIKDAEIKALENTPDNLKMTDKARQSELYVGQLEDHISYLEDVIAQLESIAAEIKEIV